MNTDRLKHIPKMDSHKLLITFQTTTNPGCPRPATIPVQQQRKRSSFLSCNCSPSWVNKLTITTTKTCIYPMPIMENSGHGDQPSRVTTTAQASKCCCQNSTVPRQSPIPWLIKLHAVSLHYRLAIPQTETGIDRKVSEPRLRTLKRFLGTLQTFWSAQDLQDTLNW